MSDRTTAADAVGAAAPDEAQHHDYGPPDPNRWRALLVIAISALMVVLDASIVNLALPTAKEALGISDADQQWVITAYTLAFGGFLLLGGRIADYVGRKRIFIVGLLGFALASALGLTLNNLNVRLHRARQRLREKVEATCHVCSKHGCLDCSCGDESGR